MIDALLFAAAEGAERAIGQRARAGGVERRQRARHVIRSFDLEGAQVRIPPHQHDFEHRVVEREMRLLRHDRHLAGELRPRNSAQVAAVQPDRAAGRCERAGQQPEQRRLASAVGAERRRRAPRAAPTG